MGADRRPAVLFLCTGNSARSILGEAILRRRAGDRFRALSAGSHPNGAVHPMALALLAARGHETRELRSKSWDELAVPDADAIDFVFTVCDAAASEACPAWPGHPATAHWGIADPAIVETSEADQREAFERAYRQLERRIEAFLALDLAALDGAALRARLAEIGRTADEEAGG